MSQWEQVEERREKNGRRQSALSSSPTRSILRIVQCHHATVACQIRDLIVTLLDPRNGASQAGTLSSSSRLEKKIIQRWKWRHSPWIFQLLLFIIMFPLVMKTTCMKRTIMSLLGHLHTSMQLEKTTPKGFIFRCLLCKPKTKLLSTSRTLKHKFKAI